MKSGWVEKLTKEYLNLWEKRFVRLAKDGKKWVLMSSKAEIKPGGTVKTRKPIAGAEVRRECDGQGDDKFYFNFWDQKKKRYVRFRCESSEERESWVQSLAKCGGSIYGENAFKNKKATMEGWCWKKGLHVDIFRPRYYVLLGPKIFYFESRQDDEARGVLELKDSKVELVEEGKFPKRKHVFIIRCANNDDLFQEVASSQQLGNWLEALAEYVVQPKGGSGKDPKPEVEKKKKKKKHEEEREPEDEDIPEDAKEVEMIPESKLPDPEKPAVAKKKNDPSQTISSNLEKPQLSEMDRLSINSGLEAWAKSPSNPVINQQPRSPPPKSRKQSASHAARISKPAKGDSELTAPLVDPEDDVAAIDLGGYTAQDDEKESGGSGGVMDCVKCCFNPDGAVELRQAEGQPTYPDTIGMASNDEDDGMGYSAM